MIQRMATTRSVGHCSCIDKLAFPDAHRTQHNIVGLTHGRLGVPIGVLPAHCCSRCITIGRVGSTDPCLRHPISFGYQECALFTSRDGAIGLIQVGWDAQYCQQLYCQSGCKCCVLQPNLKCYMTFCQRETSASGQVSRLCTPSAGFSARYPALDPAGGGIAPGRSALSSAGLRTRPA
jgi:hypothetical protein